MDKFYPSEHFKMPVIYFDWSLRRGVFAVYGETGLSYRVFLSLDELLDSLGEPHVLIGEMTFDSFNLDRRARVIEKAEREGHLFMCVPTKQTTKARFRLGVGIKVPDTIASDAQDTQAIRFEVQNGMALRGPSPASAFLNLPDCDPYKKAYRGAARELMLLRSNGEFSRNRNGNPKFKSAKERVPEILEGLLPEINERPEWFRKGYGSTTLKSNGQHKGYNATALAALAVLAKHCPTRRVFDRVSGLHVHAYGSQMRADLMFWVWAGGGKRGKIYTSSDIDMIPANYGHRKDGLTLSEFRRGARMLYREIRTLIQEGKLEFLGIELGSRLLYEVRGHF